MRVTNFELMRQRLYERAGITRFTGMDLGEIRRRQWSPEFEDRMRRCCQQRSIEWSYEFIRLMKNRLTMGAFRYGLSDDPGKVHFPCLRIADDRWALYRKTGDLELLVDVANMMLLTFVERNKGRPPADKIVLTACQTMKEYSSSKHPEAHFGSVGERTKKGQEY